VAGLTNEEWLLWDAIIARNWRDDDDDEYYRIMHLLCSYVCNGKKVPDSEIKYGSSNSASNWRHGIL